MQATHRLSCRPIIGGVFGFSMMVMAGLGFGSASAQEAGKQSQQHFSKSITTQYEAGYLLDLPGSYNSDTDKEWPMLLFLHGAGERGDDLRMVAKHGPPRIAPTKKGEFPFIVVSPQCPTGERWDPNQLIHLVDHVTENYRVDTSRIYVTGLSMGGYGTWALVTNYPEKFAAAAPICGGGDPIAILLARREKRDAIASLPIWNFHGARDEVVPPQRSETMVSAITDIGGNIRYTVYPDAGHDSWTARYDNPDLYKWLLSHTR